MRLVGTEGGIGCRLRSGVAGPTPRDRLDSEAWATTDARLSGGSTLSAHEGPVSP